jgi:hypothetical protein
MNVLKKLICRPANPLEARLDRLVGRREYRPPRLPKVASPVHHPEVELFRDASGVIRHVRIGPWRVIASSKSRSIVDVRDLACGCVVVRTQRKDAALHVPRSTTWELYNLEGHLLAMLQNVPDQDLWLATDFQTHQVSRPNAETRTLLSVLE